jgi:hypothetical protein
MRTWRSWRVALCHVLHPGVHGGLGRRRFAGRPTEPIRHRRRHREPRRRDAPRRCSAPAAPLQVPNRTTTAPRGRHGSRPAGWRDGRAAAPGSDMGARRERRAPEGGRDVTAGGKPGLGLTCISRHSTRAAATMTCAACGACARRHGPGVAPPVARFAGRRRTWAPRWFAPLARPGGPPARLAAAAGAPATLSRCPPFVARTGGGAQPDPHRHRSTATEAPPPKHRHRSTATEAPPPKHHHRHGPPTPLLLSLESAPLTRSCEARKERV